MRVMTQVDGGVRVHPSCPRPVDVGDDRRRGGSKRFGTGICQDKGSPTEGTSEWW